MWVDKGNSSRRPLPQILPLPSICCDCHSLQIAAHLHSYQVSPASYLIIDSQGSEGKSITPCGCRFRNTFKSRNASPARRPRIPTTALGPGGRGESRDNSVIASTVRELWKRAGWLQTKLKMRLWNTSGLIVGNCGRIFFFFSGKSSITI
jgi:hypothetical protein